MVLDFLLQHAPALIVALPLFGGFLTPLLGKLGGRVRNGFVLLILLITGFLIALLGVEVLANGPRFYVFGAQDLSIPLVRILFEVDSLSIFMAVISIVIALVGAIYSFSFMKEYDGLEKFYTLYLILITSVLGMELTGDLFNLFVFLEICCISSCALIAFWRHRGEGFEAAFKYIVISSIGALFVLFAIALLYGQYDALNIATLAQNLQFTFTDKIALILFIVALAMKAGLAPLHMWLPDSYGEAPAAVTLVLIIATQAGLYAFLRIIFTLYGKTLALIPKTIEIWNTQILPSHFLGIFIIVLAVVGMLIGVFMMLRQTDFTRLIAFAAVAEIGYIFLGIGVQLSSAYSTVVAGAETASIMYQSYGITALEGGIFHILNDTLDIGLLFLVAGAVYFTTKTRSLNDLSGLARNMKYTTIFFMVGLLAVSGLPPFNGFASKLLLYESAYQLNPILSIIAIVCSILLLAGFVKIFYAVFMGPQSMQHDAKTDAPKSMLLAMGIMVGIIIFIGLFPNLVLETIVRPAANALINHTEYISLIIGGG